MKIYFKLEFNELILKLAAVFHLLLGLFIVFFPNALFQLLDLESPLYIQFWQCIGIFYIVFAIGFAIASTNPGRHWAIVLVGFLAKIFVTIGFLKPFVENRFPLSMGLIVLAAEALWIIPFYYILEAAYDEHTVEEGSPKKFNDLINYVRTSEGSNLSEVSQNERVLLVFIRQFGCLFCRENVTEMAKFQNVFNEKKLKLVFVHMGDPAYADQFFSNYFDKPVAHVSDPGRHLYKSLNLKRGTFFQLFGPMTWFRGFWVMFIKGIFQGETEGDPLQLGGIFVLSKGQIVYEQKTSKGSSLFQLSSIP